MTLSLTNFGSKKRFHNLMATFHIVAPFCDGKVIDIKADQGGMGGTKRERSRGKDPESKGVPQLGE